MNSTIEEELNKNGTLIYTNRGVSMLPLLREKQDVMTITRKDTYGKNDAVLFKRDNGQYVLHRITKVYPEGYYIIGDNCAKGEYVRKEQVLGRLEKIRRGEKTITFDTFSYRLYLATRPIKRVYLKLRKAASSLYHRIKGR